MLFLSHPIALQSKLSRPSSEFILKFLLLPISTNNEANNNIFRKVKFAGPLDLLFPQIAQANSVVSSKQTNNPTLYFI
jgi:hypothetical protein